MTADFNPHYIIIGGGTSGLVVANRLSQDSATKVLIIESGNDLSADPRVNIPALWSSLIGSEADWDFETVPQPQLAGRVNAHPAGNGWNWESLVPFYKKVYTLDEPDQATKDHLGVDWINERYRGNGPLKVSFPGVLQNSACKAWIDCFRGLNKVTTGDPFSGNSIGGYSNLSTVDNTTKTRSYADSAYGRVLRERANVKIVTGATVSKVLLKNEDGGITAYGIQASVDGKGHTYTAAKEVILAAGVFNTPKLLELSGIGNKEILGEHGIHPVLDLPGVGENLQDHLMTGLSYETADGVMTGDDLLRQDPDTLAAAQKMYEEHKAGPFTIGSFQSAAFMPLINASQADIMARFPLNPEDGTHHEIIRAIISKDNETSGAWFTYLVQTDMHTSSKTFVGTSLRPENYASLGCWLSHPLSRGSTHISSPDTAAKPTIDPKHLTHPADLEILARHVQSLDMLRNTPELSSMFKPDGKRNHPDSFKVADLDVAKKYVAETGRGALHNCGTAAMMPKDKGGVVDEKLLVHGTKNLRIVDASVIPLIPRGNIISTVYAVAEKAAEIINSSQ